MIIKFIKWTKESVHYEKNTRNTNNNEKKKVFSSDICKSSNFCVVRIYAVTDNSREELLI